MREEVKAVVEELQAWLPSETEDFQRLVMKILVSLPGGERLDDRVAPLSVGWKEVELIGKLCNVLQDAQDVRDVVDALYPEEEEE
jgi:hypothetical protein